MKVLLTEDATSCEVIYIHVVFGKRDCMEHVEGSNRSRKVMLYALSTCPFCKKTKAFLKDHDIDYHYVDMDLQSREDRKRLREEVVKHNPRSSYPTLVVDDDIVVIGYREDRLKEVFGV